MNATLHEWMQRLGREYGYRHLFDQGIESLAVG